MLNKLCVLQMLKRKNSTDLYGHLKIKNNMIITKIYLRIHKVRQLLHITILFFLN